MERYSVNEKTHQLYRQAIQNGRGYSLPGEGYIYSVQNGAGIGSFFKKILNFATPLIKSVGKQMLYKGGDLVKPHLKKVAIAGSEALTRVAEEKVNELSGKTVNKLNKIGKKRKTDALS